jgi:hypothetical protein
MEKIGIYPHLDDPQLQKKITLKKEFAYKYDGAIESVSKKSKKICMKNTTFELNPHQEFVKRFISYNTPYNGLLLYHGLGSGKTCSAIAAAVASTGAAGPGDMGKVMGAIKPQIAGKADGSLVSSLVKAALAGGN